MTCDKRLQVICNKLIKEIDFIVVCGNRDEVMQEDAFKRGVSKARYGESPHNYFPSYAVDLAPWKQGINWKDLNAFRDLAVRFKRIAEEEGIDITWGGDFKGSFKDLPHYELTNWKSLV